MQKGHRGVRRIFEKCRQGKFRNRSELRRGPGTQPPDFFAELHDKPIGYQYRLANSTNFEEIQDSK